MWQPAHRNVLTIRSWRRPAGTVVAVGLGERFTGPCCCSLSHCSKSSGRLRDHAEAHVGVREPAVLRALPEEGAGLVGLDGEVLSCPGTTSFLPASSGTQKLWITLQSSAVAGAVARGEVHEDGAPGGDDQLVGGDDLGVGIVELPPPLLAVDRDLQRARARGSRRA